MVSLRSTRTSEFFPDFSSKRRESNAQSRDALSRKNKAVKTQRLANINVIFILFIFLYFGL